jgi:uncharacterized protein (DUF2141 family)
MIATLTLVLTLGGAVPDQQPARERRSAPPSGTAVIAGRVVSADAEPKPVRRARVMLNSSDREVGRTAITDDAGVFSFTALPAGRYSVSAMKAGFVNVSYGEKRSGRPGTAIPLNDAQRVTVLTLRMHRGAVITGTVLAPTGEPARGIAVSALRYYFNSGERRLGNAGSSSETDDRGAYRIYGLAAGEYVVAATPRTMSMFSPQREDIRVMTETEVRTALAMLSARGAGRATGAVAAGDVRSPPSPTPTVGYAPVFYPGTATASQAGTVSVGVAEERTGVDFQLQFAPTAKIEGLVLLPDGTPLKAGTISMIGIGQTSMPSYMFNAFRMARPDAEGRFTFVGVTPGTYAILSRGSAPGSTTPSAGPDGMRPTPPLWATVEVAVDGQNVSGMTLMLQQGMTVSGKIVLEGTTLPPPPLNRLRVTLTAAPSEVNLGASAATIDTSGQFTITGVTPGKYRLTAMVPGARPDTPGWTLKSSTIAGQETLDVPFTLGNSVADAVVTLTDTPPELSGTVLDSSGQPASDYSVVVFTPDRQYWTPQSRRIQSVRPSAAGKYTVRNLPAGDYLIAAVVDVEPGEWFDPNYLQQLVGSSLKVSVGDGEKKIQDVAVSRQP